MPKSNPLRHPLLRSLPLPLLNAAFPAFRVLCQLCYFLAHHLQLLLPRRQPRQQQSRAVGRLVHLGYSWSGLPRASRQRAFATPLGLLGDRCRSAWVASWGGHGGMDKAVCLFDAARVDALREAGHPIRPGAVGDNLLVAGLPWNEAARPGQRLRICRPGKSTSDGVLLEISEVTAPCGTTKGPFLKGDNSLMDERKHPGCSRWYARVLRTGWLAPGDEVHWLS